MMILVIFAIFISSAVAWPQEQVHPDTVSAVANKSEGVALRSSLLGTVLPIAIGAGLAARGPTNNDAIFPLVLIEGGMILGPSLGHFYAGRPAYGVITASVRTVIAVGSLWWSLSICPLEDCSSGEETKSAVIFSSGASLVVISAIYDIVTAPASVRKRNQVKNRWGLTPYVSPKARFLGLAGYVRF